MSKVEVGYDNAEAFHVGQGAYTVELSIGHGAFAYHVGPGNFPYFTKQQAEFVAKQVSSVGFIFTEYWTDGYCFPLKASAVAPRPVLNFA